MEIRELSINDIDSIIDIEKDIYLEAWNQKQYIEEVKTNKFAHYFVLIDNLKIIGYYGVWIVNDYATITKVSIHKDYQGNGLSKILMTHLINYCIDNKCDVIDLEVRVSNIKAINLYTSFGFENVNLRKNYYSNHEDALLMVRKLKESGDYERIHISA